MRQKYDFFYILSENLVNLGIIIILSRITLLFWRDVLICTDNHVEIRKKHSKSFLFILAYYVVLILVFLFLVVAIFLIWWKQKVKSLYYFSRYDSKHFSATSTWWHNFNLELSFETKSSLQKYFEALKCNFCAYLQWKRL